MSKIKPPAAEPSPDAMTIEQHALAAEVDAAHVARLGIAPGTLLTVDEFNAALAALMNARI